MVIPHTKPVVRARVYICVFMYIYIYNALYERGCVFNALENDWVCTQKIDEMGS